MSIETIHPRFSEANVAGHIGFTVLPAWFEKAAEKVYKIFMPELKPDESVPVMVKFEMECLKEINHIQDVIIETEVQQIGNSSFSLIQHLKQNRTISAIAKTTFVYFNYKHKKALLISDELRAALEKHIKVQ